MAVCSTWRKVLYVRHDCPDNYLDEEQFKKDLKENLHTQTYQFTTVVLASLSILQEINSVFLFLLVFWLLDEQTISLLPLFIMVATCSILMWFLKYCVLDKIPKTNATDLFVESFHLLVFIIGVSPVLKTLTQSISTDTIWLMTVIMFFVHLLFHNYGHMQDAPLVSDSFSLNAAIFSAVCLASRLHTIFQTLIYVLLAIVLFGILPQIRNDLQSQHSLMAHLLALGVTMVTSGLVLFVFSLMGVLVYLVQTFVITIVYPYWFVKLQYLKRIINGPWDIATITLS